MVVAPPLRISTSQIRSVNPTAAEEFPRTHDENVWQCFGRILNIDPAQCSEEIPDSATLLLKLGGLGLRSASRLCIPAVWASWADCLPMILERHPAVAFFLRERDTAEYKSLINQLEGHPRTPNLGAASDAVRALGGLKGFEQPSWRALAGGARHSILTTLTWGRPGPVGSTKLLRGWTQPSGTVSSPG